MFFTNLYRKSKHILSFIYFSPDNRAGNETLWWNMVESDWPQLTIYCGTFASHAVKIRLQTYAQNKQ